jgi:hypothetical protein
MIMVSTLNRVKYSALDFSTAVDDLRSRLQVKFAASFNDFALSSLGIMLVDIIAYGFDNLGFYLDRRATDLYLETARTRKAVARITRQLGYKMRAANASSVDLRVAVLTPQAFSIPVPKGFQFQGPNGLVFEAAQDTIFPPGSDSTDLFLVPAYEGQTFVETFVSDGSANQVFELRKVPDSSFVVSGTVLVKVNGADFEESEFLSFDKTDQFEVGYNDDPPTIRFGDGVVGNIPISTATIQITYIASRGRAGQVDNGTIDDVVADLVVNFTGIRLSVTNPAGSVGGDDLEDLDHAKKFAGKVNKTRLVAVTQSDYESLAGSFADPLFGRVAVAQAISSRSADSDVALQNILTDISAAVLTPKPAVDAQIAAANSALDLIDAQLATVGDALTDIATATTAILSAADSTLTSARASKNLAGEIGVEAQNVQSFAVSGNVAIAAIATGMTSALTVADKDSLTSFFDRISAQATSILTASGGIDSAATTEIGFLGSIKDSAHAIGASTAESDSFLLSAETARLLIIAEVGESSTPTGIRANLVTIGDLIQNETALVEQALADINAHVDLILSADCQANLVTVPILARDAGGFYAAPSSSLIQALQAYLVARKEVTQTVIVTSGANFLISAVVTVRVGIRLGVSAQVTKTAVETAVDGVLRGRSFAAKLYVSDFNDLSDIDGVIFANVTINGNLATDGVTVLTTKLDFNGNLIISSNEIITKGLITVTTEVVTNGSN